MKPNFYRMIGLSLFVLTLAACSREEKKPEVAVSEQNVEKKIDNVKASAAEAVEQAKQKASETFSKTTGSVNDAAADFKSKAASALAEEQSKLEQAKTDLTQKLQAAAQSTPPAKNSIEVANVEPVPVDSAVSNQAAPQATGAATPAGMIGQLSGLNSKTTLNDTKIGQGIKEALKVGIDKTVQIVGKENGYLSNPQIKIPMPEKLQMADGMLRKVGLGPKMDEVVLSMNRAAEAAAPHARDIFVEAIASMSLEDVQSIWKGSDTAATDFFRAKATPQLMQVYKPVLEKSMSQYQVTEKYAEVAAQYNALPVARMFKAPDITQYVAENSLRGLFTVLGQQEKQIRQDPAARVTSLLKDVFSKSN